MIVQFKSRKLQKQCENPEIAQKDLGVPNGNKLVQRIGELIAATTLADIKRIPAARLHRLKGKRSDEYAVALAHPFRLVFSPLEIKKADLNKLTKITVVRIESVEDYHGKQRQ